MHKRRFFWYMPLGEDGMLAILEKTLKGFSTAKLLVGQKFFSRCPLDFVQEVAFVIECIESRVSISWKITWWKDFQTRQLSLSYPKSFSLICQLRQIWYSPKFTVFLATSRNFFNYFSVFTGLVFKKNSFALDALNCRLIDSYLRGFFFFGLTTNFSTFPTS